MLKRVELAQGLNVKMQKSSRLSDIAGCCPIGLWSESPQVSGLRARAHAVSMSCCPIEVSEFKESEAIPDDASYDCEQTGKAMLPPALESDKPNLCNRMSKVLGNCWPKKRINIRDCWPYRQTCVLVA